jgi:hypothetical protein
MSAWDTLWRLTPNWMRRLPHWEYAGDQPEFTGSTPRPRVWYRQTSLVVHARFCRACGLFGDQLTGDANLERSDIILP